ncbi:T9SS type A sorting domain-containing protein [candidate division KSB1 bacterium]|nr:T9SS type A sorting domain-containing protein [candidate division KSB1 bacterium]
MRKFMIITLCLHAVASAQTGEHYRVKSFVVDQGGAVSNTMQYRVHDAVGQPSPAASAAGQQYAVSAGFFAMQGITTGIESQPAAVPETYELKQNYPNPFNPETVIRYSLPAPAQVELSIHDIRGHLVRRLVSSLQPAGTQTVCWNGCDDCGRRVATGLYFYRLSARPIDAKQDAYQRVLKMALVK